MVELPLDLPDTTEPLFLRISRAVARDVLRGRLRPGDVLPGSRTLAESLGVHRNTVLAAYRELSAQGLIESSAARETRISRTLPKGPALPNTLARAPSRLGFDLPRQMARPGELAPALPPVVVPAGAIALLGGLPDLSLLPRRELSRAYRRVVCGKSAPELCGYGDARGDERLRQAIAGTLGSSRGLAIGADDVVVTRGSQMALYLAARVLLQPGDVVLVEQLGYRPAWEALAAAGAELLPVPLDAGGLRVDALDERARGRAVRGVYLTPHHQYPTTVLLSEPRRAALLDLARQRRWVVFEDDYDHEFHYDGRPVLPLASRDHSGQVVYFGTLSKILAPALRTGFLVAPRPVLERITLLRTLVDRQGDRLMERALAHLLEDGELSRHARRMRRVYCARREVLTAALERELGERISFATPRGGMAIWARVHDCDVESWARACAERGVIFQTAKRFTFDGRVARAVRLGFAAETEARLSRAASRMREAWPQSR